ncbi:MAG: VOC family protein [Actinomycetota bacterium]|nr:VOC family protein [Actinomycetota bacterium]
MDPILHLALPVSDLESARAFYIETLGCTQGQQVDVGMDVWFYGLQLNLQARPEQVLPEDEQGCRHFGVTLDSANLSDLLNRLQGLPVRWINPPAVGIRGKTSVKIADPSGNIIELKSYPDVGEALHPS